MAAKGFQVIKGIDVVEGISVKCFSDPGYGASRARARVWIEDAGHDPHDWKLSIRANLRNKKAGELFTERIGYLFIKLIIKISMNGKGYFFLRSRVHLGYQREPPAPQTSRNPRLGPSSEAP